MSRNLRALTDSLGQMDSAPNRSGRQSRDIGEVAGRESGIRPAA